MALHEADREDLLREATAFTRRLELTFDRPLSRLGTGRVVFLGLRDDGRLSVYFDGDPVYHFDHLGRLRRAFVGGLLYRTQGNTLARLERHRLEQETQLLRHDLSDAALAAFLDQMQQDLRRLEEAWSRGEAQSCRAIPADSRTSAVIHRALLNVLGRPAIELADAFPTRR